MKYYFELIPLCFDCNTRIFMQKNLRISLAKWNLFFGGNAHCVSCHDLVMLMWHCPVLPIIRLVVLSDYVRSFGLSEIFDYISSKTFCSASSCSQISPKCRRRAQENVEWTQMLSNCILLVNNAVAKIGIAIASLSPKLWLKVCGFNWMVFISMVLHKPGLIEPDNILHCLIV